MPPLDEEDDDDDDEDELEDDELEEDELELVLDELLPEHWFTTPPSPH